MTVQPQSTVERPERAGSAESASPVEAPKRGSGRLGNLLKIGITIVVSAYVLWQAGLADALQTLANADWRWVALAATSAVVAMVINVKRWQVMDKCTKQAQTAFPDYTAESNAKRDAKLKECLEGNNLPTREPASPAKP